MKYRHLPLEVDAQQYWPGEENTTIAWATDNGAELTDMGGIPAISPVRNNLIPGGFIAVLPGDWVLLHPEGDFSIVKPAEFAASYEQLPPQE